MRGETGVEDVFGLDDGDGDFALAPLMRPLGLERPELLKSDLPSHRQGRRRRPQGAATGSSYLPIAISVGDADKLIDLGRGVEELLQEDLLIDGVSKHEAEISKRAACGP